MKYYCIKRNNWNSRDLLFSTDLDFLKELLVRLGRRYHIEEREC